MFVNFLKAAVNVKNEVSLVLILEDFNAKQNK